MLEIYNIMLLISNISFMKKETILIILWAILILVWIILTSFSTPDTTLSHISSMLFWAWWGILWVWIVHRIRTKKWVLPHDERTQKIWWKAISISWLITLILTSWLLIINSLWDFLSSIQNLSIIFTIMLLTYCIAYFYYKNKKV